MNLLGGIFDPNKISKKINHLRDISEKNNFWDNPNLASSTLSEKSKLENIFEHSVIHYKMGEDVLCDIDLARS